ncbi:small ubiquitin-related modifier 2-A-like isoform X1 [Rhopalosiphum padi]|uniref:small ubiquitin-related modifier 2-A-like isoform X1 n=1 Tax=Rhopalosiphum padi TaxID=40932 RepID=UPI00298DE370|nr:small ubiquitin-related modifier 2-A-like isoform X1 [Rhopalosiphum padi]XP_060854038.1 small ubiquitin-related modifier 2-A-like isoform X1 [Rhopalosiphum padi]
MAENNGDAPQCAIMLYVRDLDNFNHMHFKIKNVAPLKKLMLSYCERTGLHMEKLQFRFDGKQLKYEDTAASMGIVHDNTIDVTNVLYG